MKKNRKLLLAVLVFFTIVPVVLLAGMIINILFLNPYQPTPAEITVKAAETTAAATVTSSACSTKEKIIFDPFAVTSRTTTAVTADVTETTAVTTQLDDYSSADILITNGYICPYCFEPTEKVRDVIAKTLTSEPVVKYEQSSPSHEGWPFAKFYIKNGDDMLLLTLLKDNYIFIQNKDSYAKYKLSEDSFLKLYNASVKSDGSELVYHTLPEITMENENKQDFEIIWEDYIYEETPVNPDCPMDDFSSGHAFLRNAGIYPSMYIATDVQRKLLSDILRSCTWERLPDDAKSSIDYMVELYVVNNEDHTSLSYTGDGIFVFVKNGEVSKYRIKGNGLGIMKDVLESICYYPTRLASAGYDYDETENVMVDHTWEKLDKAIAENSSDWNTIPDVPTAYIDYNGENE